MKSVVGGRVVVYMLEVSCDSIGFVFVCNVCRVIVNDLRVFSVIVFKFFNGFP